MEPKLPPPRLVSRIACTRNHDSSRKIWEIGVPGKKSLYWSILMAYLTTPNIPTNIELKTRLINIIGDQPEFKKERKYICQEEVDEASLRSRLKNFNPFKNRHVFYFDKLLEDIIKSFKFRLNKYACKKDPSGNEDHQKLQKASQMLSCSIAVLYFEKGVERCEYFPKNKSKASKLQIFLLKHLDEDMNFKFGMDVTLANPLRYEALSFILKKAKIVLENDKKKKMCDSNEIFLITALKQMKPNHIIEIYGSPYITMKISEAGFETSPLARGSTGMSAFTHAASTSDVKLCGTLYDSAVNSQWLYGCSTRNPNDSVVDGLQLFKQQMKSDGEITREFKGANLWPGCVVDVFDVYSRFNKFQLKFVKQVVDFEDKDNNFKFRKNFIAALLKSYDEISYKNVTSDNKAWFENYFDDYVQNNSFYQVLDNFTCVAFFDNLHNLLENIPLQKPNIYNDINLYFLLLTICNKVFADDTNFHEEIRSRAKNFISFIFKINLKAKFGELNNELQNITEAPPKVKKKVIDEFYCKSLTDTPELKDEIIISKVKKYLEASSRLVLHKDATEEENLTAILVIKRAIQVVGESLKPSTIRKCVVSYLLCSLLPHGWEAILTKARNFLSHITGNTIKGKMVTERNLEVFSAIQEQLNLINEHFEIVYLFQKRRVERFLITFGLKAIKIFPSLSGTTLKLIDDCQEYANQFNELFLERESEFGFLLQKYVSYLKTSLGTLCCTESSSDKLYVLSSLIEKIAQFSDKNSGLMNYFEQCEEILMLSNENVSSNCLRHKAPTIPDGGKVKLKETLCELQNYVKHLFPPQKCQTIIPSLKPTVEVFFMCPANFNEEEKLSIISVAERIHENTKSSLKIRISSGEIKQNELTTLSHFFIFDPRRIKNKKVHLNDIESSLKIVDTCCVTWDTLKSKLESFLDNNILEHDKCRMLLLKVCSSDAELNRDLKDKLFSVMNQKLEFLLNRIQCIKHVLIEQDAEISHYFQWGHSLALKYHTKFLMVQRYVKQMKVRASLEMLLSDCSNLLGRKDLTELWLKTEYLLAGINIRDVLAHGNVILDTIGGLLDPTDMPNELVGKMIELVKDEEFISEMVNLSKGDVWYESKDEFKDVVREKELFDKCPRLESYLELMPFPENKQ